MTRSRLTVSSGTGPLEVRTFVRLLSAALAQEVTRADVVLEHTVVHGPHEAPASVALIFAGNQAVLQEVVGTHALIMPSAHRGKRARKRWYVGVTCEEESVPARATLALSDVVLETCRSGGAGGQHVNRTESAVRVTHRPSGISIRIESERSQHRNKARALEILEHSLLREQQRQLADTKSARRLRSIQVERGRPVMTWRSNGHVLFRAEER